MENIFDRKNANQIDQDVIQKFWPNEKSIINQIDEKFKSMKGGYSPEDIRVIHLLYNATVEPYLLNSLFDFYIENVDKMLKKSDYHSIRLILDLFWHNDYVFDVDMNKNIYFVHRSSPLILVSTDDLTSDIAVACYFYIDLLARPKKYNGENIKTLNLLTINNSEIYDEELQEAFKIAKDNLS